MKNRDFRISLESRQKMSYFEPAFETNERIANFYRQAQEVAFVYNSKNDTKVSTAKVHTSAVLHLVYQIIINALSDYLSENPFEKISAFAENNSTLIKVLELYNSVFPSEINDAPGTEELVRALFVHIVMKENPALVRAMQKMLSQNSVVFPKESETLKALLESNIKTEGFTGNNYENLFSFLTKPARLFPDSLSKQLEFISNEWGRFLPDELKTLILRSLDYINEEEHDHGFGGPGEIQSINYYGEPDYEAFTDDKNWMPNVVMMAKSTLVWLDQLSKKYKRNISTLDCVPDEELDYLKNCGFTALWLIGLWERSPASKKIKNLCGNPDAESSAYSLKGYKISPRLGGWAALDNLRTRCWQRGIRLASDMVPNHTGLDSDWLVNHSDYFIQQDYPPFPTYSYNGPDLSDNPDIEIKIEDHYYNRTDAAVTFRRVDRRTGQTKYIFHGNDGTTMPWNDTAQLDFLNPETREAVIQQILEVARNFHIIRFDAAMTLAKRHIQRLWYPKPGTGGDIAGRSSHGLSDEEFNRLIPNEFWREVVNRIQEEVPDTLLLAEAFWMMESYFVRTLGMHRVYNSAFMHMMKNQDNKKYRDSIKATLVFDPEILKRYVNFMNNPDEDTAIAQFGNGDKYFGVCTMLATMPGLPMFGHGQIEGFHEKYGMEYQRAYWDEQPDERLIDEHRKRIFPILKMRRLFSGCANFQLFDVVNNSTVLEDVYAYSNGDETQRVLVLYNNAYEHAEGRIFYSAEKLNKQNRVKESTTIAKSLCINGGYGKYTVCRNISDNLWYLRPSSKIENEGLWVSLDGYQTKIFVNIHEVDDSNGVYSRLYEKFGDRGIQDIELEIKLLELEPFFNATSCFRNQKFIKDFKMLLCGKSTPNGIKNIIQTLGTCYTYMEELTGLFSELGLSMQTIHPSLVIQNLKRLDQLCKTEIFTNANTIVQNELVWEMASAMIIMPLMNQSSTIEEALEVAKKLMINRVFNVDASIVNRCAIISSKMPKDIPELLQTPAFLELIGANTYQGVTWYRGEWFTECMYLTVFSKAMFNSDFPEKEIEQTIKKYLEKDMNAGYKVENLLKEDWNE